MSDKTSVLSSPRLNEGLTSSARHSRRDGQRRGSWYASVTRPRGVVLVGFGGYRGSVIAADAWGAPMRRLPVPPAAEGTHEDLLFQATGQPSLLVFPDPRDTPWLSARRGHRAIGVVYHPARDRAGNWVPTVMGRRYDAFCFFDDTKALALSRSKISRRPYRL